MFRKLALTAAAAAALVLSGCSSVELDESAKNGSTLSDVALVDQTGGGASDPRNRSIYFAFDSYTVESRYMPLVQRHARVMLAHPTRQIVIEGNTDSRGSREYNLALGQKRSEAVKQRMQLLGVPASRIEAVSFGREKPMALGENEEAWAKNRRADITYR
jgi:peptidoglycan-associated lipoprotein